MFPSDYDSPSSDSDSDVSLDSSDEETDDEWLPSEGSDSDDEEETLLMGVLLPIGASIGWLARPALHAPVNLTRAQVVELERRRGGTSAKQLPRIAACTLLVGPLDRPITFEARALMHPVPSITRPDRRHWLAQMILVLRRSRFTIAA